MTENQTSQPQVKILIVDDEPAAARMMQAALSINYHCDIETNSLNALDKVREFKPNVIILDIQMPGMDGYELCSKLKAEEQQNTPVILFISGHNTLERRLQAFDVGGDDFIAKPFEVRELQRKVNRLSEFVLQRKQTAFLQASQKVAEESMKLAAEYGNVMACFKDMFNVTTIENLASTFFSAMDRFALKSSIMINDTERHFFDYQHDRISPIEHSVYEKLQDQGRIYQFGRRMIVNDTHLSFIIKNMPEDDTEAGNIRDYCAALIEGLSARFVAIKKQQTLSRVITNLNASISHIENGIAQQQRVSQQIMSNISEKLAASFHVLDLNEAQENHLSQIIEQELAAFDEVKDLLSGLNQTLKTIRDEADGANLLSVTQPDAEQGQEDSKDIELF